MTEIKVASYECYDFEIFFSAVTLAILSVGIPNQLVSKLLQLFLECNTRINLVAMCTRYLMDTCSVFHKSRNTYNLCYRLY